MTRRRLQDEEDASSADQTGDTPLAVPFDELGETAARLARLAQQLSLLMSPTPSREDEALMRRRRATIAAWDALERIILDDLPAFHRRVGPELHALGARWAGQIGAEGVEAEPSGDAEGSPDPNAGVEATAEGGPESSDGDEATAGTASGDAATATVEASAEATAARTTGDPAGDAAGEGAGDVAPMSSSASVEASPDNLAADAASPAASQPSPAAPTPAAPADPLSMEALDEATRRVLAWVERVKAAVTEDDTDEILVPFRSAASLEARLGRHLEAIEAARWRAEHAAAEQLTRQIEVLLRTEETPDRLDAVLRARLEELETIAPSLRAEAQRLEEAAARLGSPPAEGTPAETLDLLRQVFEPVFAVKSGLETLNRQTESLSVAVVQLSQLAQQVVQDLPWLVERVERALRKVEGEEPGPGDGGPVH